MRWCQCSAYQREMVNYILFSIYENRTITWSRTWLHSLTRISFTMIWWGQHITYQSKLDIFKVCKQICIVPEHVHKTVFATVLGTFRSQVMQMGDCNTPSTFQWLMTTIFHDWISGFVHVYLDDIFIFSHSIEEDEKHLGIIFQWLWDHHLFHSKSKVNLYSKRLECLSHIIDDQGIHV